MRQNTLLKELINKVQSSGLRLTPVKRAILEILCEGAHSPTALAIQAALAKKGLTPNKSSLYRELKTLKKINLVEEHQIFKKKRSFELKPGNKHHHHFVCRKCKDVTDFQSEKLENLLSQLCTRFQREGIKIKEHELNLYGLCKICA